MQVLDTKPTKESRLTNIITCNQELATMNLLRSSPKESSQSLFHSLEDPNWHIGNKSMLNKTHWYYGVNQSQMSWAPRGHLCQSNTTSLSTSNIICHCTLQRGWMVIFSPSYLIGIFHCTISNLHDTSLALSWVLFSLLFTFLHHSDSIFRVYCIRTPFSSWFHLDSEGKDILEH